MPELHGTAVRTRYFYDDDNGDPVEITAGVLTAPTNLGPVGVLERTDPFGVAMHGHTPTGKGTHDVIEFGGLFKTGATPDIDALFADRVPEAPETPTRTFRVVLHTGRERQVETHLVSYQPVPNNENGLTRYMTRLQPTGDWTETLPT